MKDGYSIVLTFYNQQEELDYWFKHALDGHEVMPEIIHVMNDGGDVPVINNPPATVQVWNFPHTMCLPYMFNHGLDVTETRYIQFCGVNTFNSKNFASVSMGLMGREPPNVMVKGCVARIEALYRKDLWGGPEPKLQMNPMAWMKDTLYWRKLGFNEAYRGYAPYDEEALVRFDRAGGKYVYCNDICSAARGHAPRQPEFYNFMPSDLPGKCLASKHAFLEGDLRKGRWFPEDEKKFSKYYDEMDALRAKGIQRGERVDV